MLQALEFDLWLVYKDTVIVICIYKTDLLIYIYT